MTKVSPGTLSEPAFSSSRRELSLDVLRGFSLVGVGAANLMVFNAEAGHIEAYAQAFTGTLNHYIVSFFIIFLWGKYFPVFAFLFGLSAALALESKGVRPFWKRAWVLGALGVLQLIFIWKGDVLHQYALMSLLLLPLRHLSVPARIYLVVALYLVSFADVFLPHGLGDASLPLQLSTSDVFREGTFGEVFQRRMELYWKEAWSWEALFYQLRIFAWLLLGYLVGEKKRFRAYVQPSRVYLVLGVGVLVMVSAAFLIHVTGLRGEAVRPLGENLLKAFFSSLFYAGDVLLLLVLPLALYVTGIGKKVLEALAPFGKMTLTHYLTQNLLFSFVFYGYGWGLYGKVAPVILWMGYLLLVTVQVLVSIWWLRRFGQGPMEKVVRYFTTART
ncbi:DUF418 domain-containing protein [Rufibacter immobilis]|uniref:DUF418 domain-containing protein n=1 Tax=Rufibacter immobilis TaxID=1348778 RepID=UPI0016103ED4|nr:DUF418 domain-containing protein [Rufibacter immobilis]